MKWLKPAGRVQMSECGRYSVQHPTENSWIAYFLSPWGTGEKLGERDSECQARTLCDNHEMQMSAARKAG